MAAGRGLEGHRLRARLRMLREDHDLSQEELAAALGWHRSKVHRIEAGTTPISPADLETLLARLRVPVDESGQLLALARSAQRPAGRSAPTTVRQALSPSARRYVDYESVAVEIWNFEPVFVPGLLQTPEYTRAVLSGVNRPVPAAEALDRAVEVRRHRQQVLGRPAPALLHVLLDESVLVRCVGDRAVMVRQLEHLWAMSRRPNVSVSIVPFGHGAYPGLRAPFVVMRLFEQPRAGMLFIENPLNEVITLADEDSSTEPAEHLEMFERIEGTALTGEAAAARLRDAWSAFGGGDA